MSEVNKALHRIARGAGIVFVGTIISTLFGFFNKAIIARYFATAEYGVFNLALTILSIALVIATLGFGLPPEDLKERWIKGFGYTEERFNDLVKAVHATPQGKYEAAIFAPLKKV
ncbi:hypothetical protein [Thermococcus sp. MV5]|uniref:hypothetical protein n=1 Tax=Thermococcus sp. MV5 TaxID=1638272 RepID=UPI001F1029C8|nr:hypothetical protein [Thermococcus sp. MV5]